MWRRPQRARSCGASRQQRWPRAAGDGAGKPRLPAWLLSRWRSWSPMEWGNSLLTAPGRRRNGSRTTKQTTGRTLRPSPPVIQRPPSPSPPQSCPHGRPRVRYVRCRMGYGGDRAGAVGRPLPQRRRCWGYHRPAQRVAHSACPRPAAAQAVAGRLVLSVVFLPGRAPAAPQVPGLLRCLLHGGGLLARGRGHARAHLSGWRSSSSAGWDVGRESA